MQIDNTNTLFRLADDLVNHTSRNIFLTGKAGTGKTTFLRHIRNNCSKQMAVVAPTGVAAINAGGVTIHSFFQLPISPFIPEVNHFNPENDEVVNSHSLMSRMRLTKQKKQVLQELELLIIDEISMVRCDVMDAIDVVLRNVRYKYNERFGGVQLLFIGDMFQLPPVIKDQEWSLLSPYYKGPYFFNSRAMQEEHPVYIEFNKIYRQTEEKFIHVLNQVRNNELNNEGLQLLRNRFQPSFRDEEQDGYIVLTTHNEKARSLNVQRLTKLKGRVFNYQAEIKDDFSESAYPADRLLQLKVGAQVMFIKNDPERKYFNGKLGVVSELEEDRILVECKDEEYPIEVQKESWENIRYKVNTTNRQLEEEVLGSFVQYPLRLAWAITIHKSQGLSFSKAVIDAGQAFAPGQVYVALSRCTSLDGMVLKSEINTNRLLNDPRIVEFSQRNASPDQLEEELKIARKNYLQKTILSVFDFRQCMEEMNGLAKYLVEQSASFNEEAITMTDEFINHFRLLQMTAEKFWSQVNALFIAEENPVENSYLQERIKAALKYFWNELGKSVTLILAFPAITDSRIHAKELNELLKGLFINVSMKRHLLQDYDGNFNMEVYHQRKKAFVAPSFTFNSYSGVAGLNKAVINNELYQQLKSLRDQICSKRDLPVYMVAGSKTLEEMANYLPQTKAELKQISGFGKSKVESYGDAFLKVIGRFCEDKNMGSRMNELEPRKEKKESKSGKSNTKLESFNLFRQRKSVTEIAKERNLAFTTIEGHLHHFVKTGEISLEELVEPSKIHLISSAIEEMNSRQILPIKEKLGEAVSFGEIRAVIAWKEGTQQASG